MAFYPEYDTYELSRREDGRVCVWAFLPVRFPRNAYGTGGDWVLVGVENDWGAGMRRIEAVKRERFLKTKVRPGRRERSAA